MMLLERNLPFYGCCTQPPALSGENAGGGLLVELYGDDKLAITIDGAGRRQVLFV